MNAFTTFWNARSEQEKTLLAALGALGVVALVITLAVEPALSARVRLNHELEALRTEIGVMQLQSAQAHSLAASAQGGSTLTGEALRNGLTELAHQHGLTSLQVSAHGIGVRAQCNGVAFSDWIEWLDEARHRYHVRAGEAHVVALPDGRVDTQVLLDPS
jgi:general secretion pathway protein M